MTTQSPTQEPVAAAMRAWQEGVSALYGGVRQPAAAGGASDAGLFAPSEQARESFARIAAVAREVTDAQFNLAGEWLRLPLSLTSGGDASGIASGYGRLFEAYNKLAAAWFEAAIPAQVAVAERTAIEGQAQVAREVTRDAVKATEVVMAATAQAVNGVVRGAAKATSAAVEQGVKAAEKGVEQAAAAGEQAERRLREAALPGRQIKGNVSAHGEKIYHLPGQSSYERTQPEELFATEAEAQAAGYRRAETPGGGKVKAKVTRSGERIYHLSGQANYDRVEPDMLFETEEAAQAAGFRASQR